MFMAYIIVRANAVHYVYQVTELVYYIVAQILNSLLLLRCHNVKNGEEVSEVTEIKFSKVNRVKESRRRENFSKHITLEYLWKCADLL